MVCSIQQPPASETVWGLAAKQHGVVGRGQLLELGLSRRAIQHRIAKGRLHPLRRGVYAVGRPELTSRGRWMAAVLVCGQGAVLSHASAAALWGVHRGGADPIDVSVLSGSDRRRTGLRIHRHRRLRGIDVTRREGIPTTKLIVTMIDIANRLDRGPLERAVNEADRLGLVDPIALRAGLDAYKGWPGVARLRELLDRRTFRLTDSELEQRFRPSRRAITFAIRPT